MKKTLICLLILTLICSCSKIWDYPTYDITMLVDKEGVGSLLDPDYAENILNDNVTVEYDGQTYEMVVLDTRANAPRWQGLRVRNENLKFGEFSPEADYRGETFIIHWGDGTSDEVKFDLYVKGRKNVVQRIWLNGKLASDNSLVVRIVKE